MLFRDEFWRVTKKYFLPVITAKCGNGGDASTRFEKGNLTFVSNKNDNLKICI